MNHFEIYENYIPVDLNVAYNFLIACIFMFALILFRYFLVAGLFYLLFYLFPNENRRSRLIYEQLPSKQSQLFELKWSTISTLVFALAGGIMGWLWQNGYTKIYLRFDEYGWMWWPVSFFLISILHDAYFYFSHRLLHHPKIFKRFHATHHASLTPSPWASFSFHPVESLIEAIPVPLLVCLVPVHPVVIIIYLSLMTLSAVTNHLGFEVLPKGSASHPLGKWLISGVHHSQHHRHFQTNFGLFYTWWDHLMGTQNKKYEDQFNRVVR